MSEGEGDSEEEDLPVLGGEGFTIEELAQAEQHFSTQLVSSLTHQGCYLSMNEKTKKKITPLGVIQEKLSWLTQASLWHEPI